MNSVLSDWFTSNQVRFIISSLRVPVEEIPSCILFLDFVGRNHYIVHEVVIINHKNSYFDGVVTTYDHLFTATGTHIDAENVSIRRCLIAKFFGMFFVELAFRSNSLTCPPSSIFTPDGMNIPKNTDYIAFNASIFQKKMIY